jgi:hypothetical protein
MKKNYVFAGNFIEILENNQLRNVIGGYGDDDRYDPCQGSKEYHCMICSDDIYEDCDEEYLCASSEDDAIDAVKKKYCDCRNVTCN